MFASFVEIKLGVTRQVGWLSIWFDVNSIYFNFTSSLKKLIEFKISSRLTDCQSVPATPTKQLIIS